MQLQAETAKNVTDVLVIPTGAGNALTWLTVGPPSSGADCEWSPMANVPAGAKWIEVCRRGSDV